MALVDAHAILKSFAESGGSQDEAREVIEAWVAEADSEEKRDALLDFMDIVVGFISANLRVWSGHPSASVRDVARTRDSLREVSVSKTHSLRVF